MQAGQIPESLRRVTKEQTTAYDEQLKRRIKKEKTSARCWSG
jgi:hypothetical protein